MLRFIESFLLFSAVLPYFWFLSFDPSLRIFYNDADGRSLMTCQSPPPFHNVSTFFWGGLLLITFPFVDNGCSYEANGLGGVVFYSSCLLVAKIFFGPIQIKVTYHISNRSLFKKFKNKMLEYIASIINTFLDKFIYKILILVPVSLMGGWLFEDKNIRGVPIWIMVPFAWSFFSRLFRYSGEFHRFMLIKENFGKNTKFI